MLFGKASPYFSIKEMISMALFGRRKPGFSKEVTLKPEDISDEFSDRNDPAMMRNSNPKTEKAEMAARAQAVMGWHRQAGHRRIRRRKYTGRPGAGCCGPWRNCGSV